LFFIVIFEEIKLNNMDKKKDKVTPPNLLQKGWSLSKSLMRYAVEGFPNVSQEEYEQRMLMCNSCEFLNKKNSTCNVCGCAVEYKGRMETEKCPESRW
tara:strand:- start:15 stop:308 length:294 start_codon:yes stop_codon:yes gene_type:complete